MTLSETIAQTFSVHDSKYTVMANNGTERTLMGPACSVFCIFILNCVTPSLKIVLHSNFHSTASQWLFEYFRGRLLELFEIEREHTTVDHRFGKNGKNPVILPYWCFSRKHSYTKSAQRRRYDGIKCYTAF